MCRRTRFRSSCWLALVSCLWSGATAQFVPPAEGPVAFRRDRLPLDVDAMAGLSHHVATLAKSMATDSPADRRAAAQMLAIALALDPSNSVARRLVDEFAEGGHTAETSGDEMVKSRSRIWQTIGWLETPEAGSDGQALAKCLSDVMVVADPKHPKSSGLKQEGERGAWRGWVPELASYQPRDEETEEPVDSPDPKSGPDKAAPELLANATLLTPMWRRQPGLPKDDKGSETVVWALTPSPLKLSLKDRDEKDKPFVIAIGGDHGDTAVPKLSAQLTDLVAKRHPGLPAGKVLRITSEEFEASIRAKRPTSISATALALAEAAVRGTKPTGTVVALVDDKGELGLPRGFWNQLRAIETGSPGRVVVPASGAPYLPSFLALENPGFFMKNEVLLASGIDDLVLLTSSEPTEEIASILARFREIQDKLGSQDLRQYIGNRFVKQRLAELVQEAPWHFSARMLLTQAAGNRPVTLPREVLAAELRRSLRPLVPLAGVPSEQFDRKMAKASGDLEDSTREKADALERYAARDDRDLLDTVDGLLDSLRDLGRATRLRNADNYQIETAVRNAAATFHRLYKETDAALLAAAGESEVHP
ncbi:MAG: hypothetical protein H7A50_15200 [Akkermansiaceae bacterium]|nr:hypothetical protein [Akkermansiaceae bacterium]